MSLSTILHFVIHLYLLLCEKKVLNRQKKEKDIKFLLKRYRAEYAK